MELTVEELAKRIEGEAKGDMDKVLSGILPLGVAGPDQATFMMSPKQLPHLAASEAGVIICPRDVDLQGKTLIKVENPKLGFALAMQAFHSRERSGGGIHSAAVISESATLGEDCNVGAGVVIGDNVVIGDRVDILPNTVIGKDVSIGSDSLLYAHVSVGDRCELGERVILHSGVVVGSDGYGYATNMKTGVHEKIPQVGNVIIEDDVEVGSNTSIDRAVFGSTKIGCGTKIDNLVQIAHNVEIGAGCFIVSQVGIAGSTTLGHHVVVAGQAGIKDHIKVGDGAIIGGGSAVTKDVPAGATFYGQPARPVVETHRMMSFQAKLPKLFAAVKALQKQAGEDK